MTIWTPLSGAWNTAYFTTCCSVWRPTFAIWPVQHYGWNGTTLKFDILFCSCGFSVFLFVCLLSAFEILVVRAPGTIKTITGQKKYRCSRPTDNHKFSCSRCETWPQPLLFQVRTTKNLDGQPETVTWLSVGQPFLFP